MGTPDFSLSALEAVYNSSNELIAVVTQPDKPKGRGKQTTPPPVKEWVLKKRIEIPVYQPQKIRGDVRFIEEIRQLAPDLIVTAAFGQILPKAFLDIPVLGCINVHASLLPEYRGASPIQQVLIDDREKTGISIQYMDVGMDTGDVILQEEISIEKEENAGHLHDRLASLGGIALSRVLKLFENGRPAGVPQDNDKATYCRKIDKSMGKIQWNQKASDIRNLIRGLTPWPGAYTFLNGQRLKVWKAEEWEYFTDKEAESGTLPGTILKADKHNGLVVACGEGALRILELQGPGSRPMPDLDYLRGNPVDEGTILDQSQGR
jgi:methionyl-tRNA formyltransferase